MSRCHLLHQRLPDQLQPLPCPSHHQGQPPYMRSDPAQLSAVPAARKGRPDDRILGRGKGDILGLKGPAELKSSAVIKGGGTVVKSAAPKANYLLTERDMQANWDALC